MVSNLEFINFVLEKDQVFISSFEYNIVEILLDLTIGCKERRYIEELRILTKSTAIDCIIDDKFDRVIYIIQKGDMGLAIGKKGENIRRLQSFLGKRIEMVEYAPELNEFVENIFRPAEVIGIEKETENKRINVILKSKTDLGIAIGKNGCNIEKSRLLVRKFFSEEIGDVIAGEGETA